MHTIPHYVRILDRKSRVVIPAALRRGLGERVNFAVREGRVELVSAERYSLPVHPRNGRVLIPQGICAHLGLSPLCDVGFVVDGEAVYVVRAA